MHYHYCTVASHHPRWDKKNNKEINIEIIYTHVNKPSPAPCQPKWDLDSGESLIATMQIIHDI